jgi:hypothetical protein
MPEVSESEVRLACDKALNLSVADALDVRQGQSNAIVPPIWQVCRRLPFNNTPVAVSASFKPVSFKPVSFRPVSFRPVSP